jgi:Cu-Zn family superoxide dismutase
VSTATADTHDRLITAAGPTNVYNPAFADVHTVVSALSVGGRTIVVLVVTGLPKAYWTKTMGAHVHIKACGADPAAAGGHYANPAAGRTVKPADKEIWLDFKAHKAGWAISTATVDWLIEPGAARSVVIHALPTDAAGNAGARVVCSTVPFGFAGRTRPPSIS